MKKTEKALLLLLPIILAVAVALSSAGFASFSTDKMIMQDASATAVKTLTEIGNPLIAGPGGSYYDDGTLYYTDTGNTIGYNLEHTDFLFEFNIVFNQLAFPSWFSLTFRASGCDRTQSANLEQKGYSFAFFPAGSVEIWKDGTTLASQAISPILTGTKYNFKIGAINSGNEVNLLLYIDDAPIIDITDQDSPYLGGEWFNICSDGAVSANLISTKQDKVPFYSTFTLSTLGEYPMRAGSPLPDVSPDNSIELFNSSNAVGFNQYLQNFSFEFKVNFQTFAWPSNFYVSARAGGFDRAMSPALARKGYSFRFSALGDVEIYKEGASIGLVNKGSAFVEGQDYIIEIGLVDLDENRTLVFAMVDNKMVTSVIDENSPIQEMGFLNINGDGNVVCTLSSSYTRLVPLTTTIENSDAATIISTYFFNTISYQNMDYQDFSDRNLQALLIDDVSIFDLNKSFYAMIDGERANAVNVKYVDNVLQIEIQNEVFSTATNQPASIDCNTLTIKKTAQYNGLECPSGFILKQTYYFDF